MQRTTSKFATTFHPQRFPFACAKCVQEQLYHCIVWVGPLLVLATAIALLLVAIA